MSNKTNSKVVLSPWSQHAQKWQQGCGGTVCQMAEHICLARGKVPCDLLFVGEAPGESEDSLGQPFVGPAGQLLDDWVAAVGGNQYRCAFTNLVGCLPKGEDAYGRTIKMHEPAVEEIELCWPRLLEFIKIADGSCSESHGNIKLIVTVGRLADEWLPHRLHRRIPRVHITHPAAVLRANSAVRRLKAQEAVVTLKTALEGLE